VSRPKVLVAADRIGTLESAAAGAALARGFAAAADVAVVPLAVGGRRLAEAVIALTGGDRVGSASHWAVTWPGSVLIGAVQEAHSGWEPRLSTAQFGRWIAEVLADAEAPTVVLDLTGITAHDAGAGLLAQARAALLGRELVGVVPSDELTLPATGLTGDVARRGYGAGRDVAEVLAADARAKAVTDGYGAGLSSAPGGGAAGGCGAAVLSLGGRLADGPQYCHSLADLSRSLGQCDLVVTGCRQLSALDRGGPIVAAVAGWAERAQRPCIAFAGGEELSRREVRTFGLEAAHQVPDEPSAAQLAQAAVRVSVGWFGS
jgi:glycerate 2-kinase